MEKTPAALTMHRFSKIPGVYFSKNYNALGFEGRHLTEKVFINFFIQECDLRYNIGKKGFAKRESAFSKLLQQMAKKIWGFSKELEKNALNMAFIFLNRYYPLFSGKAYSLSKMNYFWSIFTIEIVNDAVLFSLLNYNEAKRKFINEIIRDIRAGIKEQAFTDFIFPNRVQFPQHFYERTRLFEYLLIMVEQMNQYGDALAYYFDNPLDIIKAHVWVLKKFGNPIKLQLGNLIGELAMTRLRDYLHQVRTDSTALSFGRKQAPVGGAKDMEF